MRQRRTLEHVKIVRSKGHVYHYFDTGRKRPGGSKIYARLPDPNDKDAYGGAYGAYLAGRHRKTETAETVTVPTLVEMFYKSPHYRTTIADGSRKLYRIYLDRLSGLLPTAPAGEVTRQDMARLIDGMADTPGAANAFLGAASSLYKWARDRHHVTNEPTKGIEPLPMGEHEPWPEALLQEALAAEDQQVRLATHLLYYTAQRIGDVLRMRWSDIQDGKITVTQKKTGRVMTIQLHRELAAELARTPKKGLSILSTSRGTIRKDDTVRNWLQEFAAARGYKVVPHGLRKNAVNSLLEAGCSTAETAAISGQTLQMVEHYAKQRNQPKLGSAAVLKWNASGTGKPKENQ
jgi:integrase